MSKELSPVHRAVGVLGVGAIGFTAATEARAVSNRDVARAMSPDTTRPTTLDLDQNQQQPAPEIEPPFEYLGELNIDLDNAEAVVSPSFQETLRQNPAFENLRNTCGGVARGLQEAFGDDLSNYQMAFGFGELNSKDAAACMVVRKGADRPIDTIFLFNREDPSQVEGFTLPSNFQSVHFGKTIDQFPQRFVVVITLDEGEQIIIPSQQRPDDEGVVLPTPTFVDNLVRSAAVTASSLNVRSGPGTQNAVVGSFNRGEVVEIISGPDANGWVRTTHGYASANYLILSPNYLRTMESYLGLDRTDNNLEIFPTPLTEVTIELPGGGTRGIRSEIPGLVMTGVNRQRLLQDLENLEVGLGGNVVVEFRDIENYNGQQLRLRVANDRAGTLYEFYAMPEVGPDGTLILPVYKNIQASFEAAQSLNSYSCPGEPFDRLTVDFYGSASAAFFLASFPGINPTRVFDEISEKTSTTELVLSTLDCETVIEWPIASQAVKFDFISPETELVSN